MKHYRGQYAAKTDRGKIRLSNEDQSAALTNERGDVLLVVCDGMGGQKKGDYASKAAIKSVTEAFSSRSRILFPRRFLNREIKKANREIFARSESNSTYSGTGTTIVAALLIDDKLYLANIGDSRCYIYSKLGGMKCMTHDQTYVDYLERTGKIEKEEKRVHPDRHVLMNALGIYPSASMDVAVHSYHGESILLCSDGLYNNLSETEIRAILGTDERADEKVMNLIADANAAGGSDNIGIAYWEAFHD